MHHLNKVSDEGEINQASSSSVAFPNHKVTGRDTSTHNVPFQLICKVCSAANRKKEIVEEKDKRERKKKSFSSIVCADNYNEWASPSHTFCPDSFEMHCRISFWTGK